MNSNKKLSLNGNSGYTDSLHYRKLVGGLLFLTHTRPDLAYAVGVVSRFMQTPSSHHLGAVKRILHYITGTVSYELLYTHRDEFKLFSYTGNSWGGEVDDRRSTTCWVFSLGTVANTWSSKKQMIIALFNTEAEYIAATSAACETVWLRRLIKDLNEKQDTTTIIYCDNKSTISITRNPTLHGRTKHIDTRYHFIRDLIREGTLDVVHCGTNDQIADILTKALPNCKHEYFRDALRVTKL